MEEAHFDLENNFELIGVTRGKKAPNNIQAKYNIGRTPTFIFFKNNREIAKFVEHAVKSFEKDILAIVKGKKYKHSYQKR